MAILRVDIEIALNEVIANEEGMRFQALAVVLAKQKWQDLVACERHKDGGLDARAPASVAEDKKGKGLACSITATLDKVKGDAKGTKRNFPDVEVLIFATPRRLGNTIIENWSQEIRKEFDFELIVMPREDIITSLMLPTNAALCWTLPGRRHRKRCHPDARKSPGGHRGRGQKLVRPSENGQQAHRFA
jgi:hypothetical protein